MVIRLFQVLKERYRHVQPRLGPFPSNERETRGVDAASQHPALKLPLDVTPVQTWAKMKDDNPYDMTINASIVPR